MNAPRFLGAFLAVFAGLAAIGYALAATLLPQPLRYFHTTFMEFTIPENWRCFQSGTEYICAPREGAADTRRAIMILAAKRRGAEDNYPAYIAHLETPRPVAGAEDGRRSVVEHVGKVRIGDRDWVFGVQFESELPSYRTYYYASFTDSLAAIATFSVHESRFGAYDEEVADLLATIRLFEPRRLVRAGLPNPDR